jgi:hypothetical protein
VVPQIAARRRSKQERLRRLAIVFRVELRLKIVAELYIKAMSPKGFFEEFGGTSVERVAQHFALLEEHGWLRRVGHKGRAPNRRGRPETLYRATDVPFFDAEMWGMLPYSLRLACSSSLFNATANELRQGIEGVFFDGGSSRDLTCTQLELDEIGWAHLIARFAADLEAIFEEQEDAKIRCTCSGEGLIRAGVLQLGFESPRGDEQLARGLADVSLEPPVPLTERLAPLLADDLAMRILSELNQSDMSVKQFHREVVPSDATEGAVRYRFDRLKDLAWIAVVDQVRKRATYEKFYRATKPPMIRNEPWAGIPGPLAQKEAWQTFVRLSDLVKESIVAGTFDIRDDRHLSWSIVYLDREGWEKVVGNLERLAAFVDGEEARASKRITAGAKPLTMVVGLAAIESRPGPHKAP